MKLEENSYPNSTTFKFNMLNVHASIDDIGSDVLTSVVVVNVVMHLDFIRVLFVRNTAKTPRGIFLNVHCVNDLVMLNEVNLGGHADGFNLVRRKGSHVATNRVQLKRGMESGRLASGERDLLLRSLFGHVGNQGKGQEMRKNHGKIENYGVNE